MDSASMMVWLTPAMIEGRAVGSCTFRSSWPDVQPKARPVSTSSFGTWRMPRLVRRTAGGMAKMMVATTPGTRPSPKSMAAGIRYTNAGMVCMKSSTGRTIRSTVSLRAAQMPSGIPSNRLMSVAAMTSASVATVSVQRPIPTISASAAALNNAKRQWVRHPARPVSSPISNHAGGSSRTSSMPKVSASSPALIMSNRPCA